VDKSASNPEIDAEIESQMNTNNLPDISQWQFSPTPGYDREDSLFISPYPHNGSIYVGDLGGRLHALNAENGEQRWRYEDTDLPIWSQPVVHQNKVYFGTGESEDDRGRVYALNRDTGEAEWVSDKYSGPVKNTITAASGIIYFSAAQETYAVAGETGEQLWSKQFDPGAVPTVRENTAYFYTGTPRALDAKSGDTIWKADTDFSTGSHKPLVTESGIYAGNGYYDIETGEEIFTFDGNLVTDSALSDDRLFTREDGAVQVFDADSGAKKRSINVFGNIRSILYADQTLYIGTAQTESGGGEGETGGVLYAIDPETGEHLWAASAINAELRLSPHADSGLIFIAGTTGQLFAVESGVNPFSDTTDQVTSESSSDGRDLAFSIPFNRELRWSTAAIGLAGLGTYGFYRRRSNRAGNGSSTGDEGSETDAEQADEADDRSTSDGDGGDSENDDSSIVGELRSEAEASVETAATARETADFGEAVDAYTEALTQYQAVLNEVDPGVTETRTEIEESIETIHKEIESVEAHEKQRTELIDRLNTAERSFQVGIVAYSEGNETLSGIRFRQARDAFEEAIDLVENSDQDLLTPPVEVNAQPDRELASTTLSELPMIPETATVALVESGIDTLNELESAEGPPWSPDVVKTLVAEETVSDSTVTTLTLLSWWNGTNSYAFDTVAEVSRRRDQADYGFSQSS